MKTVLFVDDDQFVTTLYKTKLAGEGYQVETANSGAEALFKLDQLQPNVIILDLNMPEMNGVDTLKKIRKLPGLKEVPVIIFSNGYVQSLIDEICPLGIQSFFIKSQCPPNRLITEINTTLKAQIQLAKNVRNQTALETAAAAIPPDRLEGAVSADAHPEAQCKALASLYHKNKPRLETSLSEAAEPQDRRLGRALKNLFEDLYDQPENLTDTSIRTLTQGLENLMAGQAEPVNRVQDSEAALKSILQSLDE